MRKFSKTLPTICAFLLCAPFVTSEFDDIRARLASEPGKTLIIRFKGRPLSQLIQEAKEKATLANEADHVEFLPQILEENSQKSQHHLISILKKRNQSRGSAHPTNYTQLWAFNMLGVHNADVQLFDEIKSAENIESIEINEPYCMDFEPPTPAGSIHQRADQVQPGVDVVRAPKVWAKGYKGQGVVVGVVDTGIHPTHVALRKNFRKEFGWYDSLSKKPEPYDDEGHGTHCAGTLAGELGLGVAPEAQIIACKGFANWGGGYFNAVECMEWMFCPKTLDGQKDCSKRPKVVSCSWGFYNNETFDTVLETMTSVGMIVVVAAANLGPICTSVTSPGDSPLAITVGSVYLDKLVFLGSSRGPTYDGRIKPDIAAPGVRIKSCGITSDDVLAERTGTSMATPHVAGLAALLASKDPSIDQGRFRTILEKSAVPHRSQYYPPHPGNCGGDYTYPNNHVGWGVINALTAFNQL